MELNELKKTWQKVSSESTVEQMFDQSKIDRLMNQRGKGIISRLDRNVKTGLWLLGLFILITLIDQFFPLNSLLPEKLAEPLKVPVWITLLGWTVNLIIVITFLLFVNRYRKIRVQSIINQDLSTAIKKILKLLDTFKKEFYFALFVMLAAATLGFLAGAWSGFSTIQDVTQSPVIFKILVVVLMLILVSLLIGSLFYIFHRGFIALYGKYREQLIDSLNELIENDE